MNESGDQFRPTNQFERGLINKLLNISNAIDITEEKNQPEIDIFCGWNPVLLPVIATPEKKVKRAKAKEEQSNGNSALQWREVMQLETLQKSKKLQENTEAKQKRTKFHAKRIQELSAPRKKREKVMTKNREKTVFPANNSYKNDRPDVRYNDKSMPPVTKIALQYSSAGAELRRLSHGQLRLNGLRLESSHSAHERHNSGNLFENISSKPQSHSARERSKRKKKFLPSILVKTRVNVTQDWEEHNDFTDDTSSESVSVTFKKKISLPLPHANLSSEKKEKRPMKTDWVHSSSLLQGAIKAKTSKRPLGSVTAITQGKIQAGIKSNSIKKLGRPKLPQTSVILPKLSGAQVEVPLLPKSPDFLHRLL